MIPNKSWKDKNIAERIVKLYQTEELIRAFDFDIDLIYEHVLKHLPVEQQERNEVKAQYLDFLEKMKAEGLDSNPGQHLQSTQALVSELDDLHIQLLGNDSDYRAVFAICRLEIRRLSELNPDKNITPVQVCLNAMFGFLLLRLNGKKISEEDERGIKPIGELLSLLSFHYDKKDRENGQLK
ncbi:hypothetical protein FUAX_21480 [Fulvitalea axinellae]|uniref:DUF4924 family protein n=1 Tax=Fulvitalea axinellae TaxID=1182444 RepID=A0AAU9D9Y2_9BACT|nr:hypothetical protein FUAX_21480 [Fulvitalea axinellae]